MTSIKINANRTAISTGLTSRIGTAIRIAFIGAIGVFGWQIVSAIVSILA